MNKSEMKTAIPIRPSQQAMEYMTGWKAGVNCESSFGSGDDYQRGYQDGISSRMTQWEIAKKLYPLNKEKS